MKKLLTLSFLPLLAVFMFTTACNSGGTDNPDAETSDEVHMDDDHDHDHDGEAMVYTVNTDASSIGWMGSKPVGGSHNGNIMISDGSLEVVDGHIHGGEFTIDMNSIENEDIEDADKNAKLVGHLKSADFFDVENHPTATFEVTGVEMMDADENGNNAMVSGNLTMKDITKNITFPATVNVNNGTLTANAAFDIDRSKWEVKYGSGKFFDDLGDNMISDMIALELSLEAEAQNM